jgi:hypothetical protein
MKYLELWRRVVRRRVAWHVGVREDVVPGDQRSLAHRTVELKADGELINVVRTETVYRRLEFPRTLVENIVSGCGVFFDPEPRQMLPVTGQISARLFAEIATLWKGKWVPGFMDTVRAYASRVGALNIPAGQLADVRNLTVAYFRDWCSYDLERRGCVINQHSPYLSTLFQDSPAVQST